MAVNVVFQLGRFPDNFCFEGPQPYADALVALLTGTIAGNFNGIIISANTPAVSDRDKAWIKVDSNNRPIGIFIYQGSWIWPNSRTPSSSERMIWAGSEASLWSYDGGDGTDPGAFPPTATTGAMWQRDTAFDFKIPVGIGTNPVTYDGNPATTIAVGGTGGAERVALASAENGPHSHKMFTVESDVGSAQGVNQPGGNDPVAVTRDNSGAGGPSPGYEASKTPTPGVLPTLGVTSSVGSLSHQNMPPFYGVVFAKRTARIYLVGA